MLKSHLSEKSVALTASQVYTFIVDSKLNKAQLTDLFFKKYQAKPLDIRCVNTLGKVKKFRKSTGRRSSFKKAYVMFAPDVKIIDFEVTEDANN